MLCSGTYRSISTHLENSLAGFSSQRLRAGDHAICTMNDTAAAWELDELRILSRVDSLRIETHFEKVVKETRTANSNVVGRTDEGAGNSFMSRHEDKRNSYAVICNIPNRSDMAPEQNWLSYYLSWILLLLMTRCPLHVLEQLETRLHALVSFGQVVFEKEMSARSQTFGVRG